MNSGVTAERIYDLLKRALLSGAIAPGERLEPARFAEEFASSVTPVRDALHRLTGERLVDARTSDGFHLPLATELWLRDLYSWNAALLHLAVQNSPRAPDGRRADMLAADMPRATATLFALIGVRSTNAEHAVQIAACSDRLAAARAAEGRVLDGIDAELEAMTQAFELGPPVQLLKLVRLYHRRRVAAAPEIVRALYQTGANNRSISDL